MQAKRHSIGTKNLYKPLFFASFSKETLRVACFSVGVCGSLFHSLLKSKYRIKINLHIWDAPYFSPILLTKSFFYLNLITLFS